MITQRTRGSGTSIRAGASSGDCTMSENYRKVLSILEQNPTEAKKYLACNPSAFDNNPQLASLYGKLSKNEKDALEAHFATPRLFTNEGIDSTTPKYKKTSESKSNERIIKKYLGG